MRHDNGSGALKRERALAATSRRQAIATPLRRSALAALYIPLERAFPCFQSLAQLLRRFFWHSRFLFCTAKTADLATRSGEFSKWNFFRVSLGSCAATFFYNIGRKEEKKGKEGHEDAVKRGAKRGMVQNETDRRNEKKRAGRGEIKAPMHFNQSKTNAQK